VTNGLTVFFDNYIDEIQNSNYWQFFTNQPGSFPDVCNTRGLTNQLSANIDDLSAVDNPPWPKGEFKVGDWTYRSDGNGPGTLSVPGRDDVKCIEHADKAKGKDKTISCIGLWADYYHAVATCEW
jgi:hypothetical protein